MLLSLLSLHGFDPTRPFFVHLRSGEKSGLGGRSRSSKPEGHAPCAEIARPSGTNITQPIAEMRMPTIQHTTQ